MCVVLFVWFYFSRSSKHVKLWVITLDLATFAPFASHSGSSQCAADAPSQDHPLPLLILARTFTLLRALCASLRASRALPARDCSLITNSNTQTLHLSGAASFEGCRWSGADVQLIADGPFALTFRDVTAAGGTLLIRLAFESDAGERSSIVVENSAPDWVRRLP